MTPMVTLRVGQERARLYAHEDTLSKLAFFKAALESSPKGAPEKIISMPDDDPAQISALIEYLYANDYKYDKSAYVHREPQLKDQSVGLTEALFHIGMRTVARKYHCLTLQAKALECIGAVYPGLSDIEKLRYWNAAYPGSMCISLRSSSTAISTWVDRLFLNHTVELRKILSGNPKLAFDLLRIATKQPSDEEEPEGGGGRKEPADES